MTRGLVLNLPKHGTARYFRQGRAERGGSLIITMCDLSISSIQNNALACFGSEVDVDCDWAISQLMSSCVDKVLPRSACRETSASNLWDDALSPTANICREAWRLNITNNILELQVCNPKKSWPAETRTSKNLFDPGILYHTPGRNR